MTKLSSNPANTLLWCTLLCVMVTGCVSDEDATPAAIPDTPPSETPQSKDAPEDNRCWMRVPRFALPDTPISDSPENKHTPRPSALIQVQQLCDSQLTPDVVATLQRALLARDHYSGRVTGQMDKATRDGVRSYQRDLGLDTSKLTRAAAERLGLVPIPQP